MTDAMRTMFAAGLAMVATPAFACEDVRISVTGPSWNLGLISPLEFRPVTRLVEVTFENAGATCHGTLSFEIPPSEALGEGESIFAITRVGDRRNLLNSGAQSSSEERVVLALGDGQQIVEQFVLAGQPNLASRRGPRELPVTLVLRDQDNEVRASFDIQAELEVASASHISFASEIGASVNRRTVDIDELQTGDVLTPDEARLRLWSNAPYELIFTSQNSGELRFEDWSVAYSIIVDGELLNLAGGTVRVPRSGDAEGVEILPLSIRVGETEGRRAGHYRDVLRIRMTPVG